MEEEEKGWRNREDVEGMRERERKGVVSDESVVSRPCLYLTGFDPSLFR